ncbi:MAG: type II toxin-antitoxin system PemK/MazF family toxin [Eubacteriales bacterium]|nr:type II toxin-antitoxin system PemK/MazF family toxin [Eubacteriales bacterium]
MVRKWDIYYCCLDPAEGSEQKGTRPVLVISNDSVNSNLTVSTVLPFSSIKGNEKIYPTEVYIPGDVTVLKRDSVVMIHQIRTVSHKRLVKKIGSINNDSIRDKVTVAVREYFEL